MTCLTSSPCKRDTVNVTRDTVIVTLATFVTFILLCPDAKVTAEPAALQVYFLHALAYSCARPHTMYLVRN